MLLDVLEFFDQLSFYFWHLYLLIAQIMRNIIISNRIFFWFFHLLKKIIIFSCEEPWRRIIPNISPIIQNQMVLCFAWQDLLKWLGLKVAVFITTNYICRERFFVLKEEQFLWLPCLIRMAFLLTSILGSDILANLLRINSCAFRIDVYLVEFCDHIDEMLEVRPHFDDYEISFSHFLLIWTLYFRNKVKVL